MIDTSQPQSVKFVRNGRERIGYTRGSLYEQVKQRIPGTSEERLVNGQEIAIEIETPEKQRLYELREHLTIATVEDAERLFNIEAKARVELENNRSELWTGGGKTVYTN